MQNDHGKRIENKADSKDFETVVTSLNNKVDYKVLGKEMEQIHHIVERKLDLKVNITDFQETFTDLKVKIIKKQSIFYTMKFILFTQNTKQITEKFNENSIYMQ